MTYTKFDRDMLIALYQESEREDGGMFTFQDLGLKYGLPLKQSWITQLADEWEATGYAKVHKHIGDPATWRLQIAAPGTRWVEENFGSKDGVGTILVPLTEPDFGHLNVPASDRVVSLTHNQILEAEAVVKPLLEAVEHSNGIPEDATFRQRIIGQIRAGRELIRAGEFKAALLQVTLIAALNEVIDRHKDSILAGLATNLLQYILTNGLSGS